MLRLQRLSDLVARPAGFSCSVVHGRADAYYYHYLCDGTDDRGWGCGYRTAQSLCSWAASSANETSSPTAGVPSLRRIQEVLVEVGDKLPAFAGSRNWIGSIETAVVIDQLYTVACRLLHAERGSDVCCFNTQLWAHFQTTGSPVMIGGDIDSSSKTLLGVAKPLNEQGTQCWHYLIADPHYEGEDEEQAVMTKEVVKWHPYGMVFLLSSFYNFCLPLNLTSS